jgi:DNA-binding NtrC family response regulator
MNSEERLKGKKILIVDDEPDILDTLEELLPMCEVTKASNFEEGRSAILNNHYDIAILDIMGVKGYKLLELANEKKIIAVMLTAHALSPENVFKSYREGAASYIPKNEMVNITVYLNDILEAKEHNKSFWWRWHDRFSKFFNQKFGHGWEEQYQEYKEFWENYFKNKQ